jgi:transglutaminase-like putative cysteine protease
MTSPERYTVEHETRYAYTAPVSQSWQLARLTPRVLPWQRLLSHSLQIDPPPDERRDELDSFGNMVTHFGMHGAHRVLRVRMACLVEVSERPAVATAVPALVQSQLQSLGQDGSAMQSQAQGLAPVFTEASWESVYEAIRREPQQDDLVPASMSEATPLVPLSEGARQYAARSFTRGRPWFEAVFELMQRIHDEFEFQPGATTVSTSVDEVLYQRRGVCQDFAHLMLACLRGVILGGGDQHMDVEVSVIPA